ncbi:MAG TPA: DUF2292 domain-containing protein [Verrucomicrobiae bacterium]|nr:DUF2292 domain-containing protein [Verrucomicrobiae bacterium]
MEVASTLRSSRNRRSWLEIVRCQAVSPRFGVVQIVVHDSEVTQIDTTGRVRLPKLESGLF